MRDPIAKTETISFKVKHVSYLPKFLRTKMLSFTIKLSTKTLLTTIIKAIF